MLYAVTLIIIVIVWHGVPVLLTVTSMIIVIIVWRGVPVLLTVTSMIIVIIVWHGVPVLLTVALIIFVDIVWLSAPRAPTHWKKGKVLGSGAFGMVYQCMDQDTGMELAVKQVQLGAMNAEVSRVSWACNTYHITS